MNLNADTVEDDIAEEDDDEEPTTYKPTEYERTCYPGYDFWDRILESGLEFSSQHTEMMYSRVQALYDDGVPFYSKNAIQDLHDQLKTKTERGEYVYASAIDGTRVGFEVETGRACPIWYSDFDHVLVQPFIKYATIEEMTVDQYGLPFAPRIAFCSLRIQHCMRTRNKITKEIANEPLPSLDETKAYFDSIRETWNKSQACAELRALIESARPKCDKVIAFGLGSITFDLQKPEWPPRSAPQHALIVSLNDILGSCNLDKGGISCYAQDPFYNEVDKAILKDSEITPVDDPGGFLQVDDQTVVVSICPDVPIRSVVCELAHPALIIWDKVKDCLHDGYLTTDPDSPRVKAFLSEHYECVEFPGDEENFGEVAVYIRKW